MAVVGADRSRVGFVGYRVGKRDRYAVAVFRTGTRTFHEELVTVGLLTSDGDVVAIDRSANAALESAPEIGDQHFVVGSAGRYDGSIGSRCAGRAIFSYEVGARVVVLLGFAFFVASGRQGAYGENQHQNRQKKEFFAHVRNF